MKISTLLLASAVAAAPAPAAAALDKRQATPTYAGSCTTTVQNFGILPPIGSSCSYATTPGPFTDVTCALLGLPILNIGNCNTAIPQSCSTSVTTRVTTIVHQLLFLASTETATITSTGTTCATLTFPVRPNGALASTTKAAVPTTSAAALPTLLPVVAPTLALPTSIVPTVPSLAVPTSIKVSVSVPIPAVSVPGPSLPLPPVSIPAVSVSIGVPAVSVPEVSLPGMALPTTSIKAPAVSVPAPSVPAVSVPAPSVPAVSVPAPSVPAVSVPAPSVPAVSVPAVSLPVTVPGAVTSALPTVAVPTPTAGLPRISKNGATYKGCYVDSVNSRTLPDRLADVGSVEQCVSACQAAGYSLAGLEFKHECYCGNSISASTLPDSSCNAPCDGDATETCGNADALQVYTLPTLPNASSIVGGGAPTGLPAAGASAVPATIPLVVANGAIPASYAGCYQDSVNARTLPVRVSDVGSIEQCVAACSAQGFAFAGVEYTNECYCGNTVTAPQIAITNCQKYTCKSAPAEFCGGDSALQLYRLSAVATSAALPAATNSVALPAVSNTAGLPASAVAPVSSPTVAVKAIPLVITNGGSGPANFAGCYQDSTNSRSLPVRVANVGSVEQCVSLCSAGGYALAGVEYTNECYCGNAITAPQIAATFCQKYTCSAAPTEYCGGDDSLQVYRLSTTAGASPSSGSGSGSGAGGAGGVVPTTGAVTPVATSGVKAIPLVVANGANAPATFAGCYQDSTNARALPIKAGDVGSVDQCVSLCAAQGYALAGVEYTTECYCGNAITSPQVDTTRCQQYTCRDSASQFCGGDNSLQVYRLSAGSGASPSSGSGSGSGAGGVVPTTGAVTPVATSGVKAIPLVVANGANAPATFAGCYQDSTNARSLTTQVANVGSVDQCVAACAAQGFALAGVEYTNECFCGNAITAPQIDTTRCQQYTCNAAPSQFCGGDNAIQVYRLSSGSAASPTGGAGSGSGGAGGVIPTTAAAAPASGVKAIPLVVANGANAPATFTGCYQDSTNARSLPVKADDVGSVEQCVAACSSLGYALAGVEYTTECFCGNAITAPQIDTARCQQYQCKAAANEYCGGDNAIQVYRLSAGPTAPATTAAPAGAAPTSPVAVSGATIPLITTSGATFKACYLDNTGARALRNRLADVNDAQPINTCATMCKSAGYSLAGLEYGHECWCDNSINNGQTITSNNDCSQKCDGNGQQFCGNADRVQVYNI
ncbi:WSC domain-domain-containing protein [Protomyces lactucae-debilis]|uniref:WSC domain-domain-containing protein n=1 Tax=Protomyces lactucae-debilis TaxID=2754530 RepID=A0A1Y2FSE8_PROLT|nr:WSC domain-containing protein [Protomyces lactucae-debilis]ORY86869.1 WSC domain-domain-containing protein [Protomyces lactucae-debilis]